jgi:hypothetical protein
MKIFGQFFLSILLITIESTAMAEGTEEERAIDDLLSVSPNIRLNRATAIGDLSFLSSPLCTAAVVGHIPAYFLSQKGNLVIDTNCRLLYGKQGEERYQKFREYAWDYNNLLVNYMKTNNMFNLWPVDTNRKLVFTSDEQAALESRGINILHVLFGESFPESLKTQIPEIWVGKRLKFLVGTAKDGENEFEDFDSRLWQGAHVSAADFSRNFKENQWKKIPFPLEFFERTGDKRFEKDIPSISDVMPQPGICFLGKINNLPAYVIWFPKEEFLYVILALDAHRTRYR